MSSRRRIRVEPASLHSFYCQAFAGSGVPADHAVVAADGLLYADLHGIDSHGAVNLDPLYLRMLREGTVDARGAPFVARTRAAVATVDAADALGFVGARFGMDEAIERARRFGVGAVAVRNSSHCGCLAYYTAQAVENGMIGLAFTNLGQQAILRPINGRCRLLGTNALAAAVPTDRAATFSLDATTAVAATGRIKSALRAGAPVPAGWLIDDQGTTVRDPGAFVEGKAHLQWLGGPVSTGGHKGYGLAVLIDILAGLLSGAAVGPNSDNLAGRELPDRADADIGHFFVALDPGAFGPREQFLERVDGMLEILLRCDPVSEDVQVQYPGASESRIRQERELYGIPLERTIFDELVDVADRLDIDCPREVSSEPRS